MGRNSTGAPRGVRTRPRRDWGVRLGRVAGIAIVIAPSWLASVALIVVLATPVVAHVIPGTSTAGAVAVSILLAVLLGVSVLAHEVGHCVVAVRFGIAVREVRLYLVGGVSELDRAPATPKEEAWIAAAGPAVSAVLAAICWAGLGATTGPSVVWLTLIELAVANGIIAVFNILPALPLDGGRVFRAVVWRLSHRRRLGTTTAVIGGFVVAAALLVWAAAVLASAADAALLQAGIIAVMGLFVGAGALAEWPDRRRRRSEPLASVPVVPARSDRHVGDPTGPNDRNDNQI